MPRFSWQHSERLSADEISLLFPANLADEVMFVCFTRNRQMSILHVSGNTGLRYDEVPEILNRLSVSMRKRQGEALPATEG